MWARGKTISAHCPKSVITAESLYFIEQFKAWKQLGSCDIASIGAKTADAFAVLEQVLCEENVNGEIK